MSRAPWVIAVCALLNLTAHGVQADDTHYRGVPVGAHSIGLGGAYTGVADDGSAAYFNPGGLVLESNFGIAGGLTIVAWERVELRRVFTEPDVAVSPRSRQTRTVPIFISAVVKFGKRDGTGERRYALAYSVVEPSFSNNSFGVKPLREPVQLSDTYSINQSDRSTWYGASFAARIVKNHSLGLSLYVATRRFSHNEVGLGATGGMLIGTVLDELERRDETTGLVTMCIGGGMGITTILERI